MILYRSDCLSKMGVLFRLKILLEWYGLFTRRVFYAERCTYKDKNHNSLWLISHVYLSRNDLSRRELVLVPISQLTIYIYVRSLNWIIVEVSRCVITSYTVADYACSFLGRLLGRLLDSSTQLYRIMKQDVMQIFLLRNKLVFFLVHRHSRSKIV